MKNYSDSIKQNKTMRNKIFAILSIQLLCYSDAVGASGTLDTTFGNQGITLTPLSRADQVNASVVNSSDKVILAGITQSSGGTPPALSPSVLLAQYTSTGTLDTGFNSTGIATPLLVGSRSEGNAVALDQNSKILVAGFAIPTSATQPNILIARYTTAGALDTGFNTTGYNTTTSIGTGVTANAVGIQSTTNSFRIVVAGTSIVNGIPNFTIAGFNSTTGALDTGFGTASSGYTTTPVGNMASISALAVVPSGTYKDYIVVVGTSNNQIAIARYTNLGILDTTNFNSTGAIPGVFQPTIPNASSSQAYSVAIDASGDIVVAGSANISGTNEALVLRCIPGSTVTLDTSGFNSPNGYVLQPISGGSEYYAVTIQAGGSIVTGGYGIGILTNQICMARYLSTGAIDTSYGTSGITLTTDGSLANVTSIALQSSGACVAAGNADNTISVERYTS
jgi:uncharacterized delta-60 repeat protein